MNLCSIGVKSCLRKPGKGMDPLPPLPQRQANSLISSQDISFEDYISQQASGLQKADASWGLKKVCFTILSPASLHQLPWVTADLIHIV